MSSVDVAHFLVSPLLGARWHSTMVSPMDFPSAVHHLLPLSFSFPCLDLKPFITSFIAFTLLMVVYQLHPYQSLLLLSSSSCPFPNSTTTTLIATTSTTLNATTLTHNLITTTTLTNSPLTRNKNTPPLSKPSSATAPGGALTSPLPSPSSAHPPDVISEILRLSLHPLLPAPLLSHLFRYFLSHSPSLPFSLFNSLS